MVKLGSKTAIITGVTGQDGRYLAELLLAKDYKVHGMVSKGQWESQTQSVKELENMGSGIELHSLDMENHLAVLKLIQKAKPNECYHLASPSFVSYSLNDELQNFQSSVALTHAIVAGLFEAARNCRVYYAGSSEMFGDALESPQNELTPFRPRSLYGIAKVAGYNLLRIYRDREGMFVSTGFLYNHESPRRAPAFVTRKISLAVASIKLGLQKELVLGNLDVMRDWGSAKEYVQAMWKMLQHSAPDEFVVATGQLHSVREFVEVAFAEVALDYNKFVKTDERHFREGEKIPLAGDPSKIEQVLGWKAQVGFKDLVREMVQADLKFLKSSGGAL